MSTLKEDCGHGVYVPCLNSIVSLFMGLYLGGKEDFRDNRQCVKKKKRNWLCCVRVSNSRLLCRRRKYPLKTYAMGFVNEQN